MNFHDRPIIREIQPVETPFLDEMLYQAIFIAEGERKLPRGITKHPELSRYIKNFGQKGDFCLVAESCGTLVGAIWIRLFTENEKGYGYVDDQTPELSMAVLEPYRHKGIGDLLLKEIIQKLTGQNYAQVSLSVDKLNYAYDFYCKYGFEIFESTEKSAILVKQLKKQ